MFRVIETFADIMDHEHIYCTGDIFPRVGVEASDERIRELSGSTNRLGRPLIAFEDDPVNSVEESIEPVEAPVDAVEEKPKQRKRK